MKSNGKKIWQSRDLFNARVKFVIKFVMEPNISCRLCDELEFLRGITLLNTCNENKYVVFKNSDRLTPRTLNN